jgi:hypothetical protein
MKKINIGLVTFCFLFGIFSVALAANTKTQAAPPAKTDKKTSVAPKIETFNGKIVSIVPGENQIAIKQPVTNMFRTFIVSAKEFSTLKINEEITVTFKKGSNKVNSLTVTPK